MVKKVIVTLITFVLLNSCAWRYQNPIKEKDFTFKGLKTWNNQFKINGYYYDISNLINNDEYISILYFSNMSLVVSFSIGKGEFLSLNNKCISVDSLIKNSLYHKNYYKIDGKVLKHQFIKGNRAPFTKFKIIEREAQIINDSTLKYYYPNREIKSRVFKFKQCENKPNLDVFE